MALTADDVAVLPDAQLLCVDGSPIVAANDVTHLFVPLSPRVVRLGDHADLIAREFVRRIAEHGDKFTDALKELPAEAIDRCKPCSISMPRAVWCSGHTSRRPRVTGITSP